MGVNGINKSYKMFLNKAQRTPLLWTKSPIVLLGWLLKESSQWNLPIEWIKVVTSVLGMTTSGGKFLCSSLIANKGTEQRMSLANGILVLLFPNLLAYVRTQAVINCAATSTSPAHQVERNTMAAKALTDSALTHDTLNPTDSALTHDTLKGVAKTRSLVINQV